MSRQRQDQLLVALLRERVWVTAGTLADALGVTPRSVRSYVAALNVRAPDAVESGLQATALVRAPGRRYVRATVPIRRPVIVCTSWCAPC